MSTPYEQMRKRLAIPRWKRDVNDPIFPLHDAIIFGVPLSDVYTPFNGLGEEEVQALVWMDAMNLRSLGDLSTFLSQIRVFLWMDTTTWLNRPALGRETVGEGNGALHWTYEQQETQESIFLLHVSVERPAQVSFTTAFPLREQSPLLALIATTGSCSLILDAPVAWRQLSRTMAPAHLLQYIEHQSQDVLDLTMSQAMTQELQHHLQEWMGRFRHPFD